MAVWVVVVVRLEVDKVSKAEVFALGDWSDIETMIRDKRLRFVGHLVRAGLKDELDVGSTTSWYKIFQQDLKSLGLTWKKAADLMLERKKWRRTCIAGLGAHLPQP